MNRCECCRKRKADVRERPDADVELCDECYRDLAAVDQVRRFDPGQPISIFNHPRFSSMSRRELAELEDSWP